MYAAYRDDPGQTTVTQGLEVLALRGWMELMLGMGVSAILPARLVHSPLPTGALGQSRLGVLGVLTHPWPRQASMADW